jgi:hypothetical protein
MSTITHLVHYLQGLLPALIRSRLEIIQEGNQVTWRPAQTVKLPDYQYITFLEFLEAVFKVDALAERAAVLVGVGGFAARLLQSA